MTIDEVVAKAKYIQFPYRNSVYKDYHGERDIVKLPIITDGEDVLYTNMPGNNGHHYTTKYTYEHVLPTIAKLLNIPFSLDDFTLVNKKFRDYDISYLRPNVIDNYTITCYTKNETVSGNYTVLFKPSFFKLPLYRELYHYPHTCTRIVNNTTSNTRILMISGDSQMIPSIAPLTHYFKEIWYFDNRTGQVPNNETGKMDFCEDKFISYSKEYANVNFTDVLIGCYCRDLKWYEYWNLQ